MPEMVPACLSSVLPIKGLFSENAGFWESMCLLEAGTEIHLGETAAFLNRKAPATSQQAAVWNPLSGHRAVPGRKYLASGDLHYEVGFLSCGSWQENDLLLLCGEGTDGYSRSILSRPLHQKTWEQALITGLCAGKEARIRILHFPEPKRYRWNTP